MILKKTVTALVSLGVISAFSIAQAAQGQHIIIAPKCLLKNVSASYQTIANLDNFALISADDAGVDALSEAKRYRGAKPCGGFRDVTEAWNEFNGEHKDIRQSKAFIAKHVPSGQQMMKKSGKEYSIRYQKQTRKLLKTIDSQSMWSDLKTLTAFPDRSGRTDNGVKAAAWIKDQVEKMAAASGHDDVSVYYVPTGSNYIQPSVVAKLGDATEPAVVIGGHMDTLSSTFELKPGADDDGSGTVTVLGVARTILNSGMKFKRPVYFVWYAAEEAGLVGSSYVVRDFKKKNIPVDAVIQFDMTGYEYKNDPTIWLMQDNVDPNLTDFLEKLINTYVKTPVGETACGYACSDHASWDEEGYTASMPFEAQMGNDDPYIHTSQDKMELVSLDHITDFTKLGTAFAVELAEPGK